MPPYIFLMPDWADKIEATMRLEDELRALDLPDVLRVFSAAGRQIKERRPDADREALVRELLAAIEEAEQLGL